MTSKSSTSASSASSSIASSSGQQQHEDEISISRVSWKQSETPTDGLVVVDQNNVKRCNSEAAVSSIREMILNFKKSEETATTSAVAAASQKPQEKEGEEEEKKKQEQLKEETVLFVRRKNFPMLPTTLDQLTRLSSSTKEEKGEEGKKNKFEDIVAIQVAPEPVAKTEKKEATIDPKNAMISQREAYENEMDAMRKEYETATSTNDGEAMEAIEERYAIVSEKFVELRQQLEGNPAEEEEEEVEE